MKICHACKKELNMGRDVGRKDGCPFCGADIRCCFNCSFYDPHVSKQCREPGTELVKEKGRANYCDFFSFSQNASADSGALDPARARKALDDLFKK
jgi:hypothetical protein